MTQVRRLVPAVLAALLAGLVAAGVAFVVSDEPDPAAEARLALTTEVYWPYYDAVRQELRQVVESPETRAEMDAAAGAAVRGTEVRLPGNQSFLDVRVAATTEDGALAALETGVDRVLAADLEAVNREPLARLAALDAEVAALGEELDATPREDPDRGTLELRYYQLLAEADEIRAAVASPAPRVAVLAAPALDDTSEVPARNAAIAGVLGFLVTLTLLQAFGPWRRSDPSTAR